jgi:hypothetical protein
MGEQDGMDFWTEENIHEMVANPVYCGIGPMPRLIEDDLYADAIARLVIDEGPAETVRKIRKVVERLFGPVRSFGDEKWVEKACRAIAEKGPRAFAKSLVADLRAELAYFPEGDLRAELDGYTAFAETAVCLN